jgi:hypothetical protein
LVCFTSKYHGQNLCNLFKLLCDGEKKSINFWFLHNCSSFPTRM